jgi:uncharacterized protein (TIGR02001 family)
MKTLPLLALMAVAAVGTVARAEVSSTVTLASDYDFRGISQSAKDPALQLSLDWAGDSGFYVGAWASNVDFGPDTVSDVELDIYAGYTGAGEKKTATFVVKVKGDTPVKGKIKLSSTRGGFIEKEFTLSN